MRDRAELVASKRVTHGGTRLIAVSMIVVAAALGCESVGTAAKKADEALYKSVPMHPVTGRPIANLVSEQQEVQTAEDQHRQIAALTRSKGIPLDPPSAQLERVQQVFRRLVAVAHRQELPWQVHLIEDPTVNAFTPGGGYVYVFTGLFGTNGLIVDGSDDELAAVLAHEISHVTMMHMAIARTDQTIWSRSLKDPYFHAAFSTEQEGEADRLSVLYMALAGYDPQASARVWERADQRLGSDPRKFAYLQDHPLNAQRLAITRQAAGLVASYYEPEKQNPAWRDILADNSLFPRGPEAPAGAGAGVARAIGAATDAMTRHKEATTEAERRKAEYQRTLTKEASQIQLLATRAASDAYGRPVIEMQFHNGAQSSVQALGLRVTYLRGAARIAQDPNCGGQTNIPPGQTVWLSCPAYPVQGATSFQVEVTGVQLSP